VAVRATAALAVVAVLWAWGVAQYPDVLAGVITVSAAAAQEPTLLPLVVSLSIGSAVLIPALLLLYSVSQSDAPARASRL
jgi:cytochrome d ubiquinol oxidase subunit II